MHKGTTTQLSSDMKQVCAGCAPVCWTALIVLICFTAQDFGQATVLLEVPYLALSFSVSLPVCHSFFLSSNCVPQLRWNSVDVISIALLETSTSSPTGLGWLSERIKSWIAQVKLFQFETGDPASHLSHRGTFNWMYSIQFGWYMEKNRQSGVQGWGNETKSENVMEKIRNLITCFEFVSIYGRTLHWGGGGSKRRLPCVTSPLTHTVRTYEQLSALLIPWEVKWQLSPPGS